MSATVLKTEKNKIPCIWVLWRVDGSSYDDSGPRRPGLSLHRCGRGPTAAGEGLFSRAQAEAGLKLRNALHLGIQIAPNWLESQALV